MDSSTHRTELDRQKQEEIKQQIAVLQAQLAGFPDTQATETTTRSPTATASATPTSPLPKRKPKEARLLVPATPSPRKKRKLDHKEPRRPIPKPIFQSASQHGSKGSSSKLSNAPRTAESFVKPAPSNMLSKLANLNRRAADGPQVTTATRTAGFKDRPHTPPPPEDGMDVDALKRDERLALIEDLEPGPYEHTPSSTDPKFLELEPNSGIRLSARILDHDDLQDHLRGRYYLSPSRLYLSIRLLPDKQGYDVPVPGDWITIAVVAERGPMRFTRAPVTIGPDDREKKDAKGKGKKTEESSKQGGKKYVNMKLIDFGARSQSSSAGSKSVIRGDAFLSLLLFESDGFDLITREGSDKPQKMYKGGSRGAFETMAKVKEGDVIALLNPKILKPFQRAGDTPHPVDNILAVTPESAASITVIGRSRDLGMCTVQKRDGKVCGSWFDKRTSEVCDYHLQNAVQRTRAGRAEFSVGTSGMSTTSAPKRKPAYDPARQWGLKPDDNIAGVGSTYVVSGHIVGGSGADSRTLFITENMGREGQAKAKRKLEKDADKTLKALLQKDKEGMRAVMKAREVGKAIAKKDDSEKKRTDNGSSKGKRRARETSDDETLEDKKMCHSFSAEMIKQLGFDPTVKPGHRRGDNADLKKKMEELEAIRTARKNISLGPGPGPIIRSNVVVPEKHKKVDSTMDGLPNLSDEDDLPTQILPDEVEEGKKMVDLDDF
ncbi:hypothetical protein BDQ12DRAFT_633779 [Crucibulum laeve]|uniref:Zinc finger Mcm10/DnaG-type domain-containing protein n=1 Tax=Crucibulum laeve TaxID=68775 RepID=A0A5C3LXB3_9AGAR|nr:hypothetical protein BDQ12DRAFT_633779 [Crucibulum laeve]